MLPRVKRRAPNALRRQAPSFSHIRGYRMCQTRSLQIPVDRSVILTFLLMCMRPTVSIHLLFPILAPNNATQRSRRVFYTLSQPFLISQTTSTTFQTILSAPGSTWFYRVRKNEAKYSTAAKCHERILRTSSLSIHYISMYRRALRSVSPKTSARTGPPGVKIQSRSGPTKLRNRMVPSGSRGHEWLLSVLSSPGEPRFGGGPVVVAGE